MRKGKHILAILLAMLMLSACSGAAVYTAVSETGVQTRLVLNPDGSCTLAAYAESEGTVVRHSITGTYTRSGETLRLSYGTAFYVEIYDSEDGYKAAWQQIPWSEESIMGYGSETLDGCTVSYNADSRTLAWVWENLEGSGKANLEGNSFSCDLTFPEGGKA